VVGATPFDITPLVNAIDRRPERLAQAVGLQAAAERDALAAAE
jgi:hypothetical protein